MFCCLFIGISMPFISHWIVFDCNLDRKALLTQQRNKMSDPEAVCLLRITNQSCCQLAPTGIISLYFEKRITWKPKSSAMWVNGLTQIKKESFFFKKKTHLISEQKGKGFARTPSCFYIYYCLRLLPLKQRNDRGKKILGGWLLERKPYDSP